MDLHATTQPSISGSTVVLTLANAVVPRDTSIKVSYTKPATGTDNKIKDSADLETDSFADQGVTNNTVPTLTIADGSAVTEGTDAEFTITAHAASASDITVNLTVADVSGSDFVAAANEGDKTVTLTANSTSVTYSVATVGDSTKEDSGDVTVTVAAGTGYTVGATDSASVTVNDDDNAAPTVANEIPNQSATAGTAFSFQFAANTFADADTGDTLSYTATKGDDSDLPAWLTFTAGTRTFAGTPPAADVGTLSVKVTADDGDGGTVSDTFDIVVAAADTAPDFGTATVRLFRLRGRRQADDHLQRGAGRGRQPEQRRLRGQEDPPWRLGGRRGPARDDATVDQRQHGGPDPGERRGSPRHQHKGELHQARYG